MSKKSRCNIMNGRNSATIVNTLVFYDSPQVMLLKLKNNHNAISVAIKSEDSDLNFLVAEIDDEQLARYARGRHDLRYLFLFPKWRRWHQFDLMEASGDTVYLSQVDSTIYSDERNLPEPGFFSRDHTEEVELEQTKNLSDKIYFIDGAWELVDFSRFYGKVSDLYAFFLSFSKYKSPEIDGNEKQRIIRACIEPPLKGGSSYINLFRDLTKTLSSTERLAVQSIRYASPGHVKIEGKIEIFKQIDGNLEYFMANYEKIRKMYDKLHGFMKKNKLLKGDKEKFDSSGAIADYLFDDASKLAREVGIEEYELLFEMLGRNKLAFAKVILAHFRRIQGYFLFYAEGRVRNG